MESITGRIAWEAGGTTQQAEFTAQRPLNQGGLGALLEGTPTDLAVRFTVQAGADIVLRSLSIDLPCTYPVGSRVFVNGLQSWTESREFTLEERIPPLRTPALHQLRTSGDYSFFQVEGKAGYFHSHAHTYLHTPGDTDLTGWVDQVRDFGYTIFEHRSPEGLLRVHKECAGLRLTHDCYISHVLTVHGAFEAVMDALLGAYRALPAPRPVSGWTSWYHYYTDIDQGIIQQNIQAYVDLRIPADIFQIDDGWQRAIGDWTEANAKFPDGMKAIADAVHAAGMQAGLWLAPFIVEHKSRIMDEHPEWLLTFDGDHLVPAGINPG